MRIDWIALIVAIPLAYLATAIQFGGTHAIPEWLRKFLSDEHVRKR